MSTVFIAFQANEESRPIVEAILEDNPHAVAKHEPAMVKIDAEKQLVLKRETVEEKIGRPFDLQEIHVNLITISGHIDEDDDRFILSWKN